MKTVELIKTLERLGKPFYTVSDFEKITGLSRRSLYVVLKRLTASGVLGRVGRGIYRIFTAPPDVERVAAASLYMPNYLSFESALSRRGVLTLIPYTLTFATPRKTRRFMVEGRDVEFRQIKRALFWGYEAEGGLYVAKPEKAFLDLVYLASRGKATVDMDELDAEKLSRTKLREFSRKFPNYTRKYLDKLLGML